MVWLNKQLLAQGQGQKEHVGIEPPVMSPKDSPKGLAQTPRAFPRQRGAVVPVTGTAEISGSSLKHVGVVAGLGTLGFLEPALSFLSQRGNVTPVASVALCLLVGSPKQRSLFNMPTGLFSPGHFPGAGKK